MKSMALLLIIASLVSVQPVFLPDPATFPLASLINPLPELLASVLKTEDKEISVSVPVNNEEAFTTIGLSNETRQSSDLCQCGRSKLKTPQSRIVGGTEAREGEFPWRVSLAIGNRAKGNPGPCAGTILNRRWILTAAHCFDSTLVMDDIEVTVGSVDKQKGRKIRHKSYKVHEKFIPKTFMNDVALIELAEELEFGDNISPACLPYKWVGQTNISQKVWASGWGATGETGTIPNHMLKAELDLISNFDCNNKRHDKSIEIAETQCCTYQEGKDTCFGDSGGSIDTRYNDKYYAFGIVSYGFGCASKYPGIYARISEYLPWIEKHTGNLLQILTLCMY